jgi:hypothetical protein
MKKFFFNCVLASTVLIATGFFSCYGVEEGDVENIDSGTGTDTDTDSDTDTDTDTDTDIDSDTDSDSDTDVDAGQGAYQWHTFYGAAVSEDRGYSVAVDGDGNIYVAGWTCDWDGPDGQSPLHEKSGEDDIFALKLSSSGAYQWHTFYGSSDDDYGWSLALDGVGNIYVTGNSKRSWKGPDGQSPLNAHAGDTGSDSDAGIDTDTETDTEPTGYEEDAFVLKLNSDGQYQWHTFYGSSWCDKGASVAVDGTGNVYLTGSSGGSWNGPDGQSPLNGTGDDEAFVLKLDSNGAYQWHAFYGASEDFGNAVSLDGSGNIYVTGESLNTWNGPGGESPLNGTSDTWNTYVLKLDANGAYKWHTFYESGGSALAVDGGGNIYLTSPSSVAWTGPNGEAPLNAGQEVCILKLDASGAYQWHTFYGSYLAMGQSIAIDGSGNIYVTGFSSASWTGPLGQDPVDTTGDEGFFVLKLDNNGAYEWHTFYRGQSNSIASDGTGNLVVAGYSWSSWNGPAGQSPLNDYSGGDAQYDDILVLKLAD